MDTTKLLMSRETMLKNITKLEMQIGEKTFQFLCDNDSPIGAVHDALTAMKSYIVHKINEADQPATPPESSEG